jgi:uncharacterized protein (DUF58 family)
MRSALRALTTRGRAFVSSGLTAVACAWLLGLDDLARVGALLLALPVITAVVTTRGRHRLGLVRTVQPTQVTTGQPAKVQLELSNESRTPTGLLLLEEQVPYALGVRPRFVVDRMGSRWRREVTYALRSDVRGKYTVGPMTVRATDPFGLVELDRTFASTTSVVVTPRVVPLPAIPISGTWTGSGDNRPRDFAGGSAEDVTVREYRRGDDLRRVHWRSSAHAGELMVRREEQPWQSRATIFLDNRAHVHRGAGLTSSLEYAVVATASIALHLARRGFRVRLVTADGDEAAASWHEQGTVSTEAGPLLESLAVLQEAQIGHLRSAWMADSHQAGLLVAVLGEISTHDQSVLSKMRHGASNALAVVLDVDRWVRDSARPTATEGAVPLLAANGWVAVKAGPEDTLPSVWEQLGLTSRRRPESAPSWGRVS